MATVKERRLIKRTFRGLIRLLGGLSAGLAVMLALAAWKLSSGPVSLSFLTPHIENALNRSYGSFKIRLDDTILTWAGWERTLDFRIIGARVLGDNDEVLARVPEMSMSFSARALIKGLVAPSSIELFRPRLHLTHRQDGGVEIGFIEGEEASNDVANRLIAELLADPDPDRVTGYLKMVSVIDADLIIKDHNLKTIWESPYAQVALWRKDTGIKGKASLDSETGEKKTRISISGDYKTKEGRLDLELNFNDISPAAFAGVSPELERLDAFDLPLGGTVNLVVSVNGAVESADFNINGGNGRLTLPAPFAQKPDVEALRLKGRFEKGAERLDIEDFFVDLGAEGKLDLPAPTNHVMPVKTVQAEGRYYFNAGKLELSALRVGLHGPSAVISAVIDGIGGKPEITAKGELLNLPVDDFARYWPRAWGISAQEWCVANLSGGIVKEARIDLRLNSDTAGAFRVVSLAGDMAFDGVTVDYVHPMPKASKVKGTTMFNKERFDIFFERGEAGDLTVSKGRIFITDLDKYDQYMDIELFIDGKIRTALELIDHKPLGFSSALGLDPAGVDGTASVKLNLHSILEHALTRNKVKVAAVARLQNVTIAGAMLGKSVTSELMDLKVDNRGMDITGKIRLGNIPAVMTWRENFSDNPPFRRRYELSGNIPDIKSMADLGINMGPFASDFIKGSISAETRITVLGNKKTRLEIKADLTNAALSFPALGWAKKTGIGGTAAAEIDIAGDMIGNIPVFTVAAADLLIKGSADYAKNGAGLERVALDRIAYGRTDMKGTLTPAQDGSWNISLHGAGLDLEPMFADIFKDDPEKEDGGLRFNLSADLDRVWLGEKNFLTRVSGNMSRSGDRWRRMTLDAVVGKDKGFKVSIAPGDNGVRALSMRSDDAGAVFKAFNFYENMVGGAFEVSGEFDDNAPGSPLTGKLTVDDYHLVKSPVLIRMLSILALTGVIEALQQEGLYFNILDAPFALSDGVLNLTDAKATGISLGYTASGKIYTQAKVVDLKGTVIPAYAINSFMGVLDKIPVLGAVFTGEEKGGGVFAAPYKMTGPMENPEISVNPLSLLAPGIFRKLSGAIEDELKKIPLPEIKPLVAPQVD
ncbi:MAG: hypothetical protein A3G18_02220 [Rhodospirillales bacterium RIFCSPLOWO2_12_FULL_58_28]|nr:MAG: hypothetical protein A3H92_06860 [Rhodospirillales bacterium RIFCSPLOWO2_02_FULL_58_16]OHC78871.1 MAG: hypothetical protein A3G18_02220 [Rhodospirillales bacterium RIFCSPLOWO2_12_FULL_58_28]